MHDDRSSSRPAAVAGTFYPGSAEALRESVRAQLGHAHPAPGPAPRALIAPHAGHVYSGPIAASAYARVAPMRGTITRVVLLGPVHRVPVRGLALPGVDRFETPLGTIPVDRASVEAIRAMPQVVESLRAHAMEHSIEVHLPFLQEVLGEFSLVPLAVGDVSAGEVAEVIARLWGGDETLVVVSSDLSHYLPYRLGRRRDEESVRHILALDPHIRHEQACGATPVNGLLLFARQRGMRAELLDLRSSGDTEGDREQVVGYASVAFFEPSAIADKDEPEESRVSTTGDGEVLLAHARRAIAEALQLPVPSAPDADFLREHGATFVTLKSFGQLRGCVGSIAARQSIGVDVRENALAAAFEDTRFPPLRREEFHALVVEVSRLSPSAPVDFSDEADLCRRLRPGVDGLTLELGRRRGTFLPQVWDSLADPRDFIRQLKLKMGLPADFWSPEMRASRYTVEKWSEERSSNEQ